MNIENEHHRFGSAAFADVFSIRRAGLFKKSFNAMLIGFVGHRPLWYDGAGGVLVVAGARSGKLRDLLGYNICSGVLRGNVLVLDMKGELAAISQDQTKDRKFCLYWNPRGLHDLPQHRINPVDFLKRGSPTLVADTKLLCENLVPASGSPQAVYFERRAQEFLEAVILTLVKIKGVLTLPDLYETINLIPGGTDAWLDFAFEMSEAGYPVSVRIEEEIAASREDSTGGFQGILGEIFKALSPLSDPILRESVSPPFDASLADLCNPQRKYQVYLMPPAEYVDAWAPIIKAMFVAGMVYKSRAPDAPKQTWILDECAQLGGFPLVTKLFSYGAGIGIRPVAVLQSAAQAKSIGPDAEVIIPSSAACRIYFALRDLTSAQTVSQMLGVQTLYYDDELLHERARHSKQQALRAVLNNQNLLDAGLEHAHWKREAQHKSVQHRWLRTADEVLNTPGDKAYIFVDGLEHPIYADRKPYYEQRFMAGRFHPNPYHPPPHAVRVKTWWGHRMRRVVREPVPKRFADYPQYGCGYWSKVR